MTKKKPLRINWREFSENCSSFLKKYDGEKRGHVRGPSTSERKQNNRKKVLAMEQ